MQEKKLRNILIWVVLVIGLIYIYPTIGWTFLSEETRQARLAKWKEEDQTYHKPNLFADIKRAVVRWAECDRSKVINLGLDLQGGIHMVLRLDMDAVDPALIKERLDAGQTRDDILKDFQHRALRTIERRVSQFEAKEPVIQTYGKDKIQVLLPGEKDKDRARRLIMKTAYLTFHIVAGPQETETIYNNVGRRYPGKFLPYLREPERYGQPFEVDMQYIDIVRDIARKANQEKGLGLIEAGKMIAFSKKPGPWEKKKRYKIYVIDREPLMTGEGIINAVARQDPERAQGTYRILFDMNAASGRKFGKVTQENIGKAMAIVVDGVVESAPVIQSRITTSGSITGNFSREEAIDLAIALTSGSMPAPIVEEYTGEVGATLGADSIRKGSISAVIGMILVVLFMLFYYRVAGVIANLGLLYNAILILAAMAYFNCTLTLPGIAGLILTIGMAVDANVLIYERIREELRNGRSLLASIDAGFERARVTILDANITTLIAALVLMEFGTGPIEGFAITLSIGVCSSVFSALVVSRALFDFLAPRMHSLTMQSFLKSEPKIRFLDKRNIAIAGSLSVIIIGLVAFGVRMNSNNSMFGVEFTTGTNMVVNLHGDTPVPVESVRKALVDAGFRKPIVQQYESSDKKSINRFLSRISDLETKTMKPAVANSEKASDKTAQPAEQKDKANTSQKAAVKDSNNAAQSADRTVDSTTDTTKNSQPEEQVKKTISDRVQAALMPLAKPGEGDEAGTPVALENVETIGPAMGKQLQLDAIKTVLFSFLFIIAYLWFRFELKFSIGAVVALFHDVLITIGLFALTGRQITLPAVAAILTIIGYSLNDTIVVFDRIREDLRLYRGRGLSYINIMDLSINQTLSRTLLTSITTLIVVVVLYFFGGAVINDFAFALIVGVVVGTYSSIFIASPVVYYLQKFQLLRERKHEKNTGRRRKSKKQQSEKDAGKEETAGTGDAGTAGDSSTDEKKVETRKGKTKKKRPSRPNSKSRKKR